MRERWVIDRRTGKVIPSSEYTPPEHNRGPIVLKDYEPYKSMVDGSVISGRAHHREHLKRHGCIEVGSEKMNYGNRDKPLPPVTHDEVKRVAWQLQNERSR